MQGVKYLTAKQFSCFALEHCLSHSLYAQRHIPPCCRSFPEAKSLFISLVVLVFLFMFPLTLLSPTTSGIQK